MTGLIHGKKVHLNNKRNVETLTEANLNLKRN